MSFDLGVWHTDERLTDEEAANTYLRLCEEPQSLNGSSQDVAAFYAELTGHWPEIDTIPEESIGDFDICPWSCALDHSGNAVVMSCVWSKADEVFAFVSQLAKKHKLVLFDPQENKAHRPEHLTSAKKRGLIRRFFG
jgi:hypothetical protein